MLSRGAMLRWRTRMMAVGKGGKLLMGGVLVVVGLAVVSGLDKQLEAALVAASPDWLTQLTTRF
jgi:cytochrome c-type biogenesis protein